MLIGFSDGSCDIIRPDVKHIRCGMRGCADAGVGEILCVNELISVVARADRPYAATLVDELKEDREQSQPPEIDDRRTADDDYIQILAILTRVPVRLPTLSGRKSRSGMEPPARLGITWNPRPPTNKLDDVNIRLRTPLFRAPSAMI